MNPRAILRVVPAVTLVATLLWSGPAAASCAGLPTARQALKKAAVAFVGTVAQLTNEDRWAVVTVEEVWKGSDIPSYVQIQGGEKSGLFGSVRSSVDREFVRGRRYLFFPHGRDGAVFQDNSCSATTRYHSGLDALRPDTASAPIPVDPIDTGGPPWGLIAVLLGILVVVFIVARRSVLARKESAV